MHLEEAENHMKLIKTPLLVGAVFLAAACIHGMEEVKLSTSADGIPAAQGAVKTMGAPNDNTRLIVKVKHLAPPERVENGATTYVVWAQPDGTENVQNVGALTVDKNLNGTLMTVLPFKEFKVFITAESTGSVTQPTGQELLAANVDESK